MQWRVLTDSFTATSTRHVINTQSLRAPPASASRPVHRRVVRMRAEQPRRSSWWLGGDVAGTRACISSDVLGDVSGLQSESRGTSHQTARRGWVMTWQTYRRLSDAWVARWIGCQDVSPPPCDESCARACKSKRETFNHPEMQQIALQYVLPLPTSTTLFLFLSAFLPVVCLNPMSSFVSSRLVFALSNPLALQGTIRRSWSSTPSTDLDHRRTRSATT